MRFQCLACFLLAGLVYGQATPAAPPAAKVEQAAPAPPPEVKPDDPIITVKGLCADGTTGDSCQTVITRAEFDKLAESLQPGMNMAFRRQLATRYSWALRMSAAAEKRGLDKTPAFEEKMHFARMQILAQSLSTALQEDAAKITDEDVADYYKKNEPNYEQATFMRIFVPRAKQILNPAPEPKPGAKSTKPVPPPPPTEAQKKASEEAMTKLAATLRADAVKGEDTDKLQKEAYVAAGLPGNVTNTKMERVRRTTLPPNQQSVMDLKPGEVSEVINDSNGGHYIYKMVSKETLSLDSVAPEIKRTLSSQRYRDSIQAFQDSKNVVLNDAYFGPVRNPMMFPAPGPRAPIEHNPAEDDKDPD